MTFPSPPDPAGEGGFTLVELLVTMVLAIVVLFAILQGAEILQRTTAASSRLTAAQEDNRRAIRELTDEARQAASADPARATPLEAISRSSIVFAAVLRSVSGAPAGWVRYCATTDGRLVRGQRTSVPSAGDSAATCGAPGAGWTYTSVIDGRLSAGSRLFSYSASATYADADCPQQPVTASVPNPPPCLPLVKDVTGVGIRLAVSDGSAVAPRTVVTRGAVSFRNRSQQ